MVDSWFKPLPDVVVPLLDGSGYSLHEDGLGKVVILDFWATWCAPCKNELPRMQALYEALREKGLDAIAINAEEPAETAREYAQALGLTMPIGTYSGEVKEAFHLSTLPLVIIADRWGRMRARWDGYKPGYELKIEEIARSFIAEEEPPTAKLAEPLIGGSLFRADWSRELLGVISGITVLPGAGGEERVLASVGRSLISYKPDGQTEKIWDTDFVPGLPRASAAIDSNDYFVVAFHPGGERLTLLHMPEGVVEQIYSPEPVFDAIPLDTSSMLLAAYEGMLELSSDGEDVERLPDYGGASSVALIGEGDERQTIALEFGGSLSWLDPSYESATRIQTTGNGWRLLAHESLPGEAGIVPMAVTAAVTGNFLRGSSTQAALATTEGRLLLVDLETGRQIYHALWPEIVDLASGDLDGDGLDELVVASGSRLSVLTARSSSE
jgi:thiol-disulfide isomerase/thioredoxin